MNISAKLGKLGLWIALILTAAYTVYWYGALCIGNASLQMIGAGSTIALLWRIAVILLFALNELRRRLSTSHDVMIHFRVLSVYYYRRVSHRVAILFSMYRLLLLIILVFMTTGSPAVQRISWSFDILLLMIAGTAVVASMPFVNINESPNSSESDRIHNVDIPNIDAAVQRTLATLTEFTDWLSSRAVVVEAQNEHFGGRIQ
jgi:hypothetical protein